MNNVEIAEDTKYLYKEVSAMKKIKEGMNFLSQEKNSFHRKKFLDKVGNFLSQELGENFMSHQVVFHVDKQSI